MAPGGTGLSGVGNSSMPRLSRLARLLCPHVRRLGRVQSFDKPVARAVEDIVHGRDVISPEPALEIVLRRPPGRPRIFEALASGGSERHGAHTAIVLVRTYVDQLVALKRIEIAVERCRIKIER